MENTELVHWGIKGMRWGVRRYQNKNGTLTPAGKKRYNDEMEKLKEEKRILTNRTRTQNKISKLDALRKELKDKKEALDSDDVVGKLKGKKQTDSQKETEKEVKIETKKKKLKDMSTEELKQMKERLQLEKDTKDLLNSTRTETSNKGRAFVENVLTKAGEELVTQTIKYFGAKAFNKVIGDDNAIHPNNKKK